MPVVLQTFLHAMAIVASCRELQSPLASCWHMMVLVNICTMGAFVVLSMFVCKAHSLLAAQASALHVVCHHCNLMKEYAAAHALGIKHAMQCVLAPAACTAFRHARCSTV
jgi:hypothetical protein